MLDKILYSIIRYSLEISGLWTVEAKEKRGGELGTETKKENVLLNIEKT